MRSRVLKSLLVGCLGLSLLAVGTVAHPGMTDAAWSDTEVASGTFAAKVIPPVSQGGTSPYCSWTTGGTASVKEQWVLPAGYGVSRVIFTAQVGTTTTSLSGVNPSLNAGVYTSSISVAALTTAFGSLSGKTVIIHVMVNDVTTWTSKPVNYSFVFNASSNVTSCSITA